tara:strand:+ start:45 stop:521 length:477 start_codon:yes stop_codon:yes gene_type:complete
MKKGRLKEIVAELQAASKMHLKQSKEIAAHLDDMESPTKMVSPLDFEGANSSNSSCWDGYRKDGVKDSPSGTGETVNNCVKIGSPAKQDYNEVNVQDLQDMGKVKKNKKGKYVVNENPKTVNDTLYIPKKFRSYTGKKLKVGEMIDESDYENLSNETN